MSNKTPVVAVANSASYTVPHILLMALYAVRRQATRQSGIRRSVPKWRLMDQLPQCHIGSHSGTEPGSNTMQ
jgi:hypothetical protein